MSENEPELTRGQKAAQTRAYDDFVKKLIEIRKQISGWHTEIENLHKELLIDSESQKSAKARIQDLIGEIETRKGIIEGIQNELSAIKNKISGDGEKAGVSGEIDLLAENVRKKSSDIAEYLKRLESAIQRIDGETDEQGNKTSEGYLSKIEALDKAYNNSLKENDSKGKQLLSEIEAILANATNVELAKGFEIQKKSARNSKWLWGAGFTLSIALMAVLGLIFYFTPRDVGPLMQTVLNLSPGTETKLATETVTFIWIVTLFQKLVIYVPLIWFALKCSKNQSQAARFEAEYAHKEAIAITYNGHKAQLDTVSTEDGEKLKSLLAGNLIAAVAFNPSETMEKGYHDQDDSFISKVASLFLKKKKEENPANPLRTQKDT